MQYLCRRKGFKTDETIVRDSTMFGACAADGSAGGDAVSRRNASLP